MASIKIEGLEELRRALRQLPEKLQKQELSKSVQAGAFVIRDDAKARAPVLKEPSTNRRAGVLRNAIRATRGIRRDSEATSFVYVKLLTKKAIAKFKKAQAKLGGKVSGAVNPNDPFYWRFLEFGTSKMAAQPFLRPAFDTKKETAAFAIKEALRAGLARVAAQVKGRTFT